MCHRSVELDSKTRKSSFKTLSISRNSRKECMSIMYDIFVDIDNVNKMRIHSLSDRGK